MISQTSEESIATGTTPPPENDTLGKKEPGKKRFASFGFLWKRDSREKDANDELIENNPVDSRLKNGQTRRVSFEFFRNVKKRMHIRNLGVRKTKQKIKETEATSNEEEAIQKSEERNADETFNSDRTSPVPPLPLDVTRNEEPRSSSSIRDEGHPRESNAEDAPARETRTPCTDSTAENVLDMVPLESRGDPEDPENADQSIEYLSVSNPQMNILRELAISDLVTSDSKVKASLAKELLNLSRYGWYWGPISGEEADAKLISEPDGAFLVRDSSDDRYVLTLSFKSSGKLLHTRMEHSGGLFSLCNQSESEGFSSVAELIAHSMNFSQTAVFCYSRPKYPGYPSFPVRLTKPVSRFTQVRSLQYLCRFVIRQNTRLDNIQKLPLPKTIKGYIQEAHY